jgi:DNA (cytosine-5)-methyltransferase 1
MKPSNKNQTRVNRKALCLFSSAGIGELGLEAAGIDILLANELLPERVDLYRENFQDTEVIQGDIWQLKEEIIKRTKKLLGDDELFLIYATPPCQGMSTNGTGKLKAEIESGRRELEEPRNRLIIPTLEIIRALKPRFVLLENVPQMTNTAIRNEEDETELILDFVRRRMPKGYKGSAEVLSSQDYGIPQRRKRLITIYTRDEIAQTELAKSGSFFCPTMKSTPITLRQAIGHLPALDSRLGKNSAPEFHPQHRVPIMKDLKYWWVSHTPQGDTAFNNQCINKKCKSTQTPGHQEAQVNGKWVSLNQAPLHCITCGDLLPRPSVQAKDGSIRPLKGFHSAYRRMRWDEPSRTLTQNFIYEASDNKIHPEQNRVLSIFEAMIIQSIAEYQFKFEIDGRDIGIAKIAEVIGESVPPRLIQIITERLVALCDQEPLKSIRSKNPKPVQKTDVK